MEGGHPPFWPQFWLMWFLKPQECFDLLTTTPLKIWAGYNTGQLTAWSLEYTNQCGAQNLNTEGMHMVRNRSHTYFSNNDIILQKNAIIVGCLVVFEGMKSVSRPCTKGSQTLLKGSTPFKKGLVTSLIPTVYIPMLIAYFKDCHCTTPTLCFPSIW